MNVWHVVGQFFFSSHFSLDVWCAAVWNLDIYIVLCTDRLHRWQMASLPRLEWLCARRERWANESEEEREAWGLWEICLQVASDFVKCAQHFGTWRVQSAPCTAPSLFVCSFSWECGSLNTAERQSHGVCKTMPQTYAKQLNTSDKQNGKQICCAVCAVCALFAGWCFGFCWYYC